MSLYHIDQAIAALVDPETGEILDYEAFEALSMEREDKVENMMLAYKNFMAEAEAIRKEESALQMRRLRLTANAMKMEEHIAKALSGQPFKTARCEATFRKSRRVEFDEEKAFVQRMIDSGSDDLLRYPKPVADKEAIKKCLASGIEVPGARLVENNNITIK